MDSRGEADIFFDKSAKIVLTKSDDTTIWTLDDVQPLTSQTVTGKYNQVDNGSFELDGDGDGVPDNWNTTSSTSTATIEIDTTTVAHGTNSFKFASAGAGAGTATTANKFPVPDGDNVGVSFFVSSNNTTATNKVDLIFYDSSGGNTSTTNVWTGSGTQPSSLTLKSFGVSVPAGKTQADVKLTGVSNSETATTYFDNVQVLSQSYLFTGTPGEVTADASELNKTDGLTATTAELNKLDGVTATTAELNKTDGLTASTANLNNIDGLTVDISGIGAYPFAEGDIAAGAVGQSEVAASAIGQGELKTTNGSVSETDTGDTRRALPGGQYGFNPEYQLSDSSSTGSTMSAGVALGFFEGANTETTTPGTDISMNNYVYIRANLGDGNGTLTVTARQRYVQASPPYDLGDGECGLFIEADVRPDGSVAGLYVSPDPVWANNGPTNIRPDFIDKKTGKKYKSVRRPSLTRADLDSGRIDMADYIAAQKEAPVEAVEITMAYKNADMDLFPHSWASPPNGTICLLDPVNTHDLLMLHEAGEDVADMIHRGYIQIGDEVKRKGPPGVVPVTFKWKNTRR